MDYLDYIINACYYVADKSIITIAEKCPHLELISMDKDIINKALVKVAGSCSQLRHVSLVKCFIILQKLV